MTMLTSSQSFRLISGKGASGNAMARHSRRTVYGKMPTPWSQNPDLVEADLDYFRQQNEVFPIAVCPVCSLRTRRFRIFISPYR